MANDNNKDIELKIKVDTSDVDKSMKDVEKSSDKMSKNVSSDAKRMSKDTEKINKVFKDLQKTLKNSSKEMQNAFKNINTNGFNKTMNDMKNTATKTASTIKQQLQDAFNVKGNVKVSTTTDKSNGVSSGNGMANSLAGSAMSGGAMGSKIAKDLALSQKEVAKAISGIKKAFGEVPETIQKDMKNAVSSVYGSIQEFDPAIIETIKNLDIDLSDPKELKGIIAGIKDDMETTASEFKRINAVFERQKRIATKLGKDEEVSSNEIGMQRTQKRIEEKQAVIEKMKKSLSDLSKVDFALNMNTSEPVAEIDRLLGKFDEIPTAMKKADVAPIVEQFKILQEQMQQLGMDTSMIDNVLAEWNTVCQNNTKGTVELTNAIKNARTNIDSMSQGTKQLIQTQIQYNQRQAEINRHTSTLGQVLVKSKHHLQDFGTALKRAFSGGVQKAGQYIDNLKNKSKQLADAHKQAADKIKSANAGITASFKSLLATMAPFLTIIGVFNLFKQSTTQAMEALENNNMYMAVFGDKASQMDKWIKSVNQSMGLGVNNTKQYTAIIQQMGRAMNLSSDEAMEMSKSMATMAGDISSFYNVDIAQAQEDLRSALSGSNEVLTKYGIVLREDTIKQFAYANGIAAMGAELTSAQRAMALTLMVEQQLGQANNDMAKTLQSPSNQLRILKTNLQELKVALGQCFLPVIQVILPLANQLLQILTVVTQKIADTIRDLFALFGVNISTGGGGGVVADTFGDVADSSGVISDNFSEANKDAKEMAKSLASFDKLNVLNTNKSSSGSSSNSSSNSGGVPTIGSMGGNTSSNTASEATKGISKFAQQIHDAIVNNPYFKSLKNNFFGLVDTCRNFIKSSGGWLKLFMDNGGREFLANLGDCALIIGDILVTALKDGVTWITNFLNSAKGQAVIKTLGGLCKWLSERLKDILLWIRENKGMLYKLIGVVATVKLGFAAFIKVAQGVSKVKTAVGLVKSAIGKLPGILKGVKGAWETMRIAGMLALDKIKLALPGVLSGAKSMLSGAVSAIGSAITAVAGAMGISAGALVAIIAGVIAAITLIVLNWDKVKEYGIKAWNGIKYAWSASNQWCYNNIVSPMINHFRNMWNTARDLGTRAWDGIKNTWKGMSSWYGTLGQRVSEHFSNMWNSIKNGGQNAWRFLQRVFNSGGSFFRDITSSMGNAFKSVLNVAIRGINNIISIPFRGINSAIRGLKNTSILGARPFSFLRELNVPQIPYLAKGGIVDSATLAMIGEGRQNEAVIPLDTFYNKLSHMFAEQNRMLMQSMQNGNGNATIVLQLDGKEVARGTVKNMKEMSRLGQLDMSWL